MSWTCPIFGWKECFKEAHICIGKKTKASCWDLSFNQRLNIGYWMTFIHVETCCKALVQPKGPMWGSTGTTTDWQGSKARTSSYHLSIPFSLYWWDSGKYFSMTSHDLDFIDVDWEGETLGSKLSGTISNTLYWAIYMAILGHMIVSQRTSDTILCPPKDNKWIQINRCSMTCISHLVGTGMYWYWYVFPKSLHGSPWWYPWHPKDAPLEHPAGQARLVHFANHWLNFEVAQWEGDWIDIRSKSVAKSTNIA